MKTVQLQLLRGNSGGNQLRDGSVSLPLNHLLSVDMCVATALMITVDMDIDADMHLCTRMHVHVQDCVAPFANFS